MLVSNHILSAKDIRSKNTGTFTVIDNHNVLHSRGKLNLDEKTANQIAKSANFFTIPRLLYRSKGPFYKITTHQE